MSMGPHINAKAARVAPAGVDNRESQAHATDASSSKLSRYAMRGGALVLAAVLGTRGAQLIVAGNIESTWGTLEQPRFGLAPNIKFYEVPTFQQEMRAWLDAAQTQRAVLMELRNRVEALELGGRDATDLKQAVDLYEKHFGALVPISVVVEPAGETPPRAIATPPLKPELDRARELIESLTGAKIPANVTINLDDVGLSGMEGFANSLTSTITVNPCVVFSDPRANYLETVGCIGHEYGHLVFRYGEQQFASMQPWNGVGYETSVREEAAAVLFRTLLGAQISDPQERFYVSGSNSSLITRHLRGERDYGISEGAALADAARTLHPDPYAAYAAITTPGALDPALREVIKANGELRREITELQRANEAEIEMMRTLLKAALSPG